MNGWKEQRTHLLTYIAYGKIIRDKGRDSEWVAAERKAEQPQTGPAKVAGGWN